MSTNDCDICREMRMPCDEHAKPAKPYVDVTYRRRTGRDYEDSDRTFGRRL